MNICVVGAGMQGSVVAQDLVKSGHAVTVLDNDINLLRQLKKTTKVNAREFNVTNKVKFIRLIKSFDVVVGALPAAMGFYTMDCAMRAGVDLVDLSYSPEDPFLLHERAEQEGIRIVPDAGFAPGLSNILIGETYQEFKGIDNLRILVGGIPQKPEPPFNYHVTWSLADVIEEYVRPSKIVKNREMVTVQALSGVEEFSMPKIGRLECFYTDGLRTLLKTLKHVKNMEEKTIRYPGHAQLFKMLIDCGFLSEQSVRYRKRLVNIKDVNIEYLRNILRGGDKEDLSILMIEIKKGSKKRKFTCIDYYDRKKDITSMARMTAYTGSIITQCIKDYEHFGIVPPEHLGMDKKLCRNIKAELKKRNIIIKKS
ncbi:MAG: saccharopine dehydrogenase C-terminal domain-containing protein [bacterium]